MIIRLGIIGAGDHMKSHIAYLFGIQGIEIVGVVDKVCNNIDGLLDPRSNITSEQLESFAPNPIFFNNSEDLYSSGLEFDAVLSGTPDIFHTLDIESAVNNGKHIMLEKPLATSLNELERLKESLLIAQNNELIVSSCHARRFDPPFLWLKDNFEALKQKHGNIMGVDYDFSYAKLRKKGLHEGLLTDHFNHEIDLLNFLLGFSHITANRLTDNEEQYQASGVREDGVSFMFRGSRFLDTSRYHEVMIIRFQKGVLQINTSTGEAILDNHETKEIQKFECGKTDYEKRLRAVNQNFIGAISGEEQVYLTHQDLILNTASGIHLTINGTFNSRNYI